jgi:hypothetical protein
MGVADTILTRAQGVVDLIWLKCHRQGFFGQTITQPFIHSITPHMLYDKKKTKRALKTSVTSKFK